MAGHLLPDLLRELQNLGPRSEGTDCQLVERFVAHRDEAAFAALVRRHAPLVLGVGRRVLRHPQDAEDVFQATFLLLARHAASRRWQPSIAGWLYSVAYRLALRAAAQAARRRQVERGVRPTEAGGNEERTRALDEELQRLPAEYREPIVACYLEAKTRDQAARHLGLSLRTLERRLSQGLSVLRERLGRRGVELPAALLAVGLSQQATSAALVTATVGLAAGTSGTSPAVAALVEGGWRTMSLSTMTKSALAVVLLLALSATGILIGGSPERPAAPPVAAKAAAVETNWPEGATVKGRVVDHRGDAVEGAEVVLLGKDRIEVGRKGRWGVIGGRGRGAGRSTKTNAMGEFTVTIENGPADRVVVIAASPLFWSVPRKDLAAAGPVEVKLPEAGSLAIACDLPGKAAKQPLRVTHTDMTIDGDILRFWGSDEVVTNPGEKVYEDLPPVSFSVERTIRTRIGKVQNLSTAADRQLVKVESNKRATVRIDRKVGRPLTIRVRGIGNEELRTGYLDISSFTPEVYMRDGKPVRVVTSFDVLPVNADGTLTTDPIPPGNYSVRLYAVKASTPEQTNEQADFSGSAYITVPEKGEMPVVELVAYPDRAPRRPNTDPRVRVVDPAGKPLPKFEAMLHTDDHGYTHWAEGRDGVIGFPHMLGRDKAQAMAVLVRADGFAPTNTRFEGTQLAKLTDGTATVTMQPGQKVEIRFRMPSDRIRWSRDFRPDAYFEDLQHRVRTLRQPVNNRDGRSTFDYNMLALRPVGDGRFEVRLTKDTPPFHVGLHAPGFLQQFEAGPFTLADFARGVLEIPLPMPTAIVARFDAGPTKPPDLRPYKSVTIGVMRQIRGNEYVSVADDVGTSPSHTARFEDLAPGTYMVTVRTQPKPDSKTLPDGEINPGAFMSRKQVTTKAGTKEDVPFDYTPFDPTAYRGKRAAVVRVRLPDGSPAKGRKVAVSFFDGHYGELPVFSGPLPASGELRLENLTDRVVSPLWGQPYIVRLDGVWAGKFGFGDAASPTFDFRVAPKAGDLAPDVELTHLGTGKPLRLDSLRGKVVCLEFWATWCGPCQPAMAKLNAVAAEKAAAWKDRVVVLPVSIDAERDVVQPHLRRRGWSSITPYWAGAKTKAEFDSAAAEAFGVTGVPTAFLIGRDGRILWRGHPSAEFSGKGLDERVAEALK